MRLLKPRPVQPAAQTSVATGHFGTMDPPIVAALVKPLLALRSALGSGRPAPNPVITTALTSASSHNADAESQHRDGVYTLESSWSGPGAQAAVPALRTTQTQLGDITDRGPAYLGVLADAQNTSARAATQVDRIIANFRADAKTILAGATAAPDTDALINRAAQALRDAITAVTTAQTEMADHTQRLSDIGPMTVVQGVSAPYDGSNQTGVNQYGATDPANSTQYGGPDPAPNTGAAPASANRSGDQSVVPAATATGAVPADPAQAAQLQLQQQLISAGVQLGTSAINAGVDIGTHLIDKIAELGTHLIDSVATEAETVVPELLHLPQPNGTASTETGGTTSGTGTEQTGVAIPGAPSGTGTLFPGLSTPAPSGSTPVPSLSTPAPSVSAPPSTGTTFPGLGSTPAPAGPSVPSTPNYSVLPPDPGPAAPDPATTAPPAAGTAAPAPAHQDPGPVGGMALPATPSPGTTAPKPDSGQLGVTEPAALELVPAAVIGEFGDDSL
ncbi:hypothetical protein [Nocardia stercoris]|uniref:hypothetical protein n=1 Tax=Nocardia stercoris TaxID=2483361 RepID=UPI001319BB3F|nr:hypothetical protein [Nocardia stercoris]